MNTHSCPSAIHIVCLLLSAFAGCQNSDSEIAKGASAAVSEQESEGSKQFAEPEEKALSSETMSEDSYVQRQQHIALLLAEIGSLATDSDDRIKAILKYRLREMHEQLSQKYPRYTTRTLQPDPSISHSIVTIKQDSSVDNRMLVLNPEVSHVAELEKIKKELVELIRKSQESGDAKTGKKPLAPSSE